MKVKTFPESHIPLNWRDHNMTIQWHSGQLMVCWELDPDEFKIYTMPFKKFCDQLIKLEGKKK